MKRRHSWLKLRLHVYMCRHCGTGYENRRDGGSGWIRLWYLPDGTESLIQRTPPCEPGRTTDKRLAKYGNHQDVRHAS